MDLPTVTALSLSEALLGNMLGSKVTTVEGIHMNNAIPINTKYLRQLVMALTEQLVHYLLQ